MACNLVGIENRVLIFVYFVTFPSYMDVVRCIGLHVHITCCRKYIGYEGCMISKIIVL